MGRRMFMAGHSEMMQHMVRCVNGHLFDYRNRIRIEGEDMKHYAPCQGRCPDCGTTEFSFIGSGRNIAPIHFNYVGAEYYIQNRSRMGFR